MKLLRRQDDLYEFRLGTREHRVLRTVLQAFPVTPLDHHHITRGPATPALDEAQTLLRDSLAESRREARTRLEAFLADPRRFLPAGPNTVRVRLSREEMEWLLQLLNEVRVGCWVRLGCPDLDDPTWRPRPDPDAARHLALMEAGRAFELELLAALDGTDGVGWSPQRRSAGP